MRRTVGGLGANLWSARSLPASAPQPSPKAGSTRASPVSLLVAGAARHVAAVDPAGCPSFGRRQGGVVSWRAFHEGASLPFWCRFLAFRNPVQIIAQRCDPQALRILRPRRAFRTFPANCNHKQLQFVIHAIS